MVLGAKIRPIKIAFDLLFTASWNLLEYFHYILNFNFELNVIENENKTTVGIGRHGAPIRMIRSVTEIRYRWNWNFQMISTSRFENQNLQRWNYRLHRYFFNSFTVDSRIPSSNFDVKYQFNWAWDEKCTTYFGPQYLYLNIYIPFSIKKWINWTGS